MAPRESQLEVLARRINWLVRYRRALSIVLAGLASLAVVYHFSGWYPRSWPGGHMVAITVMVGTFCWYAIETAFGFVLALWETDYAGLTRPATLPAARLLRRK